ncbi:glycoside hydrolase family 43 protein [Marinimicrobium koreense]|uniref:glycoside hydrolase family 43 protein n=1 Tax=Marinimicrobium koreense TaxID=306545 RepID=UPI003F6F654D
MVHYGLKILIVMGTICLTSESYAEPSNLWSPQISENRYQNPIIHADYSDPDICQVGNEFYMTASSFNSIPGLPILHSKDLVNWAIVNHALPANVDRYFDVPRHGKGVWAPSFHCQNGTFYIFWGDPDRGIFMVKTDDPRSAWSAPVLVKEAHGNIDPSVLWDDDGKVYMVHAFAHTRAGVKSLLQVVELSSDASEAIDFGKIVFDAHDDHPTLEGPKFYKRNGYYYIFAPGGGVTHGWQVVLRSRNIYGPYEDRIVLAQGETDINGPHQGGLVELESGESWFIHFQDKIPYGRITHLQPVRWVNDWPVMGADSDGDGTGSPVLTHPMPNVGDQYPIKNPQDSDEFTSSELGLQWQWNANPMPDWASLDTKEGWLDLTPVFSESGNRNLWYAPNLLKQKLPAAEFVATAKVDASGLMAAEEAGMVLYGMDYATLSVARGEDGQLRLKHATVEAADSGFPQTGPITEVKVEIGSAFYIRTEVSSNATAQFSYSLDGNRFRPLGKRFSLEEGRWVGAQIGLYANRYRAIGRPGSFNVDWFRFTKP